MWVVHLVQMTSTTLDKFKTANIKVWSGVVNPNEGIYLPMGYILSEVSLNGEECSGVRWILVDRVASLAMKGLVAKVFPEDISGVKPNTSLGFLLKVVQAINAVQNNEAAVEASASKSKRDEYVNAMKSMKAALADADKDDKKKKKK